ncbi:sodium:proton antiporter [Belnapia sp. T6]|uniref:Sodium:proton antiporter n=1 Tax=Belnapia mucosa TaxID=2804532 RepID=A0ABS1V8Z7_9PROT|nr:sodium:proton antiporter [Belnapia mucosa]MBL6457822.1 sodium:proton antiporter [Belnapia mucosa]
MLSLLDLAALLLTLSAGFGWINHRFLRLPSSIGLLGMGLVASLLMVGLDLAFPQEPLHRELTEALRAIDFEKTVMDGLLAFLLFAGALHLDIGALRGRALPVAVAASLGTVVSTGVIGGGLWLASGLAGHPLPLAWALVFGALISPTDPVAVMGTLKAVSVPQALETDMSGESLFNDGVGVVIFALLLAVAQGEHAGPGDIGLLFLREAVGGAVLGTLTGFLAYRMTRRVDEHALEVMLSLALATGTYALAQRLEASGPIAVVAAGLLLGNRGARLGMSERTRRYVFGFWEVLDYGLNAVLFLLIGLEVLVMRFDAGFLGIAALAVVLALTGRFVAVGGAVLGLHRLVDFSPGTVAVLTWGGLRGGISIALALSLPEVAEKPALLAATYAVAVFSVLVQGGSLGWVARRWVSPRAAT